MSTENLNDFQWDKSIPEMDFFGESNKQGLIKEESEEASTDVSKIDETDEKSSKEPEKEPEKEDKIPEGVDFTFGIDENKNNEEDEDEEDEDDLDDDTVKSKSQKVNELSNSGVLNFLKEKGLVDYELEEDQELTEEDAEALLEDAFEESLDSRLEETLTGLPDRVKNLVKYVAKGGDADEFLSSMSSYASLGVSEDMDISKESNQEKFMRFKLAQEGNDEEYIDAQIEFMKDTGKLEPLSEKAFEKWRQVQNQEKEEKVQAQKEAIRKAREQQIQYKKDIINTANTVNNINGLRISKKESRELPDYITNANIETEDGRVTTGFYNDLSKALRDKNKILALAKIIKTDFDFSDIEKTTVDKVTKNVKKDIQRQQETQRIKTAGGSSQPKRLADYFND